MDLRDHTVLLVVAGSRAYGTATPTSDVDLKGAYTPPAAWVYGFRRAPEQIDDDRVGDFVDRLNPEEVAAARGHGVEGTIYDVRKLIALATQANPNILDVLFCREAEIRLVTEAGSRLRQARDLFLTARARQTFSGYARAQLKRINNHRGWLLAPPAAAPARADFGLPEVSLVPRHQLDAAEAAIRKRLDSWELDLESLEEPDKIAVRRAITDTLTEIGSRLGLGATDATWLAAARGVGLADDLIEALKRERAFRSAQRSFRQYQHWKAHRNPARAALEAEHGYDCKHAAHLVRLLRMGTEILGTGRVHVWRGPDPEGPADAEELKAIRDGAWSYDELLAYAEAEEGRMEQIVATGAMAVPSTPDRDAIDRLCIELVAAGVCG